MAEFPARWDQGRDEIEQLLRENRLHRIAPNRAHGDRLIMQAETHLRSARLDGVDESSAFTLIYDAARKALTAVLEVQGLRPTTKGGHRVVLDAILAQCEPPVQREFRKFGWIRRRWHENEYPDAVTPPVTQDDVDEAHADTVAIVACAKLLVARMPPF